MEATVEQLKQDQRMYSWLRKIYPTLTDADREEARQIFPEVLESEDDRIRNDIMEAVENWLPYERVEEIRFYLRKQKEQQPVHTAKEMWKEMRLEVYAQASGNRHEPNYSDDSTKMFSLCDIDEIFEKIGNSTVGPQPAGCSEEDEKMFDWLHSVLCYVINDPDLCYEKREEISKELLPFIEKLKSLHPCGGSEKPNNQAEWSEEDEDKVDDICKLIEHATIIPRSGDDDTGIPPTRLNDKYKGELKAFVKSFRNRPTKSDTWKPSEEQMKWLKDVIETVPMTCRQQVPLESLYADLKKL